MISPVPKDIQEDVRRDRVLEGCKVLLNESRELRSIPILKSKGRTRLGRINPTPISKEALRKTGPGKRTLTASAKKESNLARIDPAEIQRRKEEGECLQCAWPSDRKGVHKIKDCRRALKLDKGTACFPKAKEYQKPEDILLEQESEETSSEESSDHSL
jgi:hypothetical protein